MPVEIRLPQEHILDFDAENQTLLRLPTIELYPTRPISGNPRIVRITPKVRNIPSPLSEQILAAYNPVDYSEKPFSLTTPQRLSQNPCRWNLALPENLNGELRIIVEYYFLNPEKQRHSPFILQQVEAVCRMITLPKIPQESVPASTNGKKIEPYPGWFAIDFGTSNSTITLYDPNVGETPRLLPIEQKAQLCKRLGEWLESRPADPRANVSQTAWDLEWEKLTQDICLALGVAEGDASNLGDYLFGSNDLNRELNAIEQLEISLSKRLDWFRRSASQQIHQIEHDAFRVPPLTWQNLSRVILDQTRKKDEIPSELEITQTDPIQVVLGEDARQNCRRAIANGDEIEDRFLHSPKRYLGQKEYASLLQAAYAHLIQLVEAHRQQNPEVYLKGPFFRAIMTYPTVASPAIRRDIEAMIKQMFPSIKDVVMRYDEAVAVALFFLWKEFGGSFDVGIEAFKTRCQTDGMRWWQNLLVLDIGGGTTDLALLRLTLEDISDQAFQPGESRGDGGRYYRLTPKLLRSSGNLHLGGEQITLQVFKLLKVMIVDRLLSMSSDGQLANAGLKLEISELSDSFLERGHYQKGKLLTQFLRGQGDEALKFAERVLPTRWQDESCQDPAVRLNTFYALWDFAEDAKLQLGKSRSQTETEFVFEPNPQTISEVLKRAGITLTSDDIQTLNLQITVSQFNAIATPIIRTAVKLSEGLIKAALPAGEQLDNFILSGKTCELELVRHQLYEVFKQSDYFTWNPEQVTFESQYSKLATSAGACLAEKFYQYRFVPRESVEVLRLGINQLYIDVKNLFYSLPCSFIREIAPNGEISIFEANDELHQLSAKDEMVKRRSKWAGVQPKILIRRKDFEGEKKPWGNYDCKTLMDRLGMNENEFLSQIKVQFEINQKLDIELLLCQGEPHYLIDFENGLDISSALESQPIFAEDGHCKIDLLVHVLEYGIVGSTQQKLIFHQKEDYSKKLCMFRDQSNPQQGAVRGVIAELPPFPISGKHSFYLRQGNEQPKFLGELSAPMLHPERAHGENPHKYYVSFSETGILQVHAFEVPYWTASDETGLKQPGCVYRDTLGDWSDPNKQQDPFCGKH